MSQKALTVTIVALLVAAGVAFAMTRSAEPVVAPTQEGVTTTENGAPTTSGTAVQGAATYDWRFETYETNAFPGDSPKTRVALVTGGRTYALGTFEGSCSVLAAGQLLENQRSGALCWFAGAGDELGVFEEGGRLVVKQGVQQEPSGEGGGFRGDFKTVLSL